MDEHTAMVKEAFLRVLDAEGKLARIEAQEKRFKALVALQKGNQGKALADAWADVQRLMKESGEPEVTLPGAVSDYKIATSAGTEVVDAPDVEAVPHEWVKVEKSVKKKELLAHLKELREAGKPLPNWASIKRNPGTLGWVPVKKKPSK